MRILYDNALLNRDVVLDMKLHESTLCDNGKIPDMSKYHNNATITGAVWTPPYGYTLDGYDDYFTIPNAPSLNPTGQITLIAYMKTGDDVTEQRTIFTKPILPNAAPWQSYTLKTLASKLYLQLAIASSEFNCFSSAVLATNTEYQLAGTYDGNIMTTYINSVVNGTFAISGSIDTNTNDLNIGLFSGLGRYGKGIFHELFIYGNKALSSVELKQHYLAAKERLTWANLP